jgi:RHS repeat-associated protein
MSLKKTFHTVDGEIIGETTNGMRTHYLTDALGSVTATIDSTVAIARAYRYKPYGDTLMSVGSGGDPKYQWVGTLGYRRTGRAQSDLYVRQRHYAPRTGTWNTADRYWPFQTAFGYTNANPVSYVDPNGAAPIKPGPWDRTWILPYPFFHGPYGMPIVCPKRNRDIFFMGKPIGPCVQTERGNCPYQQLGYMIDISQFSIKQTGKRDEHYCDPSQVDKDALNRRIDYLRGQVNVLCGQSNQPGAGGGGLDYEHWAETRPCHDNNTGDPYRYFSCAIRCAPNWLGQRKLGDDFYDDDTKTYRKGRGCLACCMLAHENYHCLQIVGLRFVNQSQASLECEAHKRELQCLLRVQEGKPCS